MLELLELLLHNQQLLFKLEKESLKLQQESKEVLKLIGEQKKELQQEQQDLFFKLLQDLGLLLKELELHLH